MYYEFWWDTGGRSSHFLLDVKASENVVNHMCEEYNDHPQKVSFVTFLRAHNIPARAINPVEVEFYPKKEQPVNEQIMLTPDFAPGAEIRQVQEKVRVSN